MIGYLQWIPFSTHFTFKSILVECFRSLHISLISNRYHPQNSRLCQERVTDVDTGYYLVIIILLLLVTN